MSRIIKPPFWAANRAEVAPNYRDLWRGLVDSWAWRHVPTALGRLPEVLVGSPTDVVGPIGPAVHTDGVDDEVTWADSVVLRKPSTAITVAFLWEYDNHNDPWDTPICKRETTDSSLDMSWGIRPGSDGLPQWTMLISGTNRLTTDLTSDFTGSPHLFVARWASGGVITFDVFNRGVLVESAQSSAYSGSIDYDSGPLIVGSRRGGGTWSAGTAYMWNIWERQLTDQVVQQLARNPFGMFTRARRISVVVPAAVVDEAPETTDGEVWEAASARIMLPSEVDEDASFNIKVHGEVFEVASARIALPSEVYEAASVRLQLPSEIYEAGSVRLQLPGEVYAAGSIRISLGGPSEVYSAASIRVALPGDIYEAASIRIALRGEVYEAASVRVALRGDVYETASLRVALPGDIYETASVRIQMPSEVVEAASVAIGYRGETYETASLRVKGLSEISELASINVTLRSEVYEAASVRIALRGETPAAGSIRVALRSDTYTTGSFNVLGLSEVQGGGSVRVVFQGQVYRAGSARVALRSDSASVSSFDITLPVSELASVEGDAILLPAVDGDAGLLEAVTGDVTLLKL